MTVYHGTTKEAYEMIQVDGYLQGDIYVTPNMETAKDYAFNNSNEIVIIELWIDKNDLHPDREFVKNGSGDWLEESLENGSAVYHDDIRVDDFEKVHHFNN